MNMKEEEIFTAILPWEEIAIIMMLGNRLKTFRLRFRMISLGFYIICIMCRRIWILFQSFFLCLSLSLFLNFIKSASVGGACM